MGGCQSRVEVRECVQQLDTFDRRVKGAAAKRSELLEAEAALPVRRRDKSASIALVPYLHEFGLKYPSWFPRDEPLQLHFRSVLSDINLVLQNQLEEQMVLNDQMRKFHAGPGYGDAIAAWSMDSRKLKTSTTTSIQRVLGAANRANPHGPRLWGLKGLASIEQEHRDRLEIVFNMPSMAQGRGVRPGTASSTSTSGSRGSRAMRPSGSRADMRAGGNQHDLFISGGAGSSVVEPAHVAVRSGSVSSLRTARTIYDLRGGAGAGAGELRGSGSSPSLGLSGSAHLALAMNGAYKRATARSGGASPSLLPAGRHPGGERGAMPSRWGGAAHGRSMRTMTGPDRADDRAEELRGAEAPSYGRHGNQGYSSFTYGSRTGPRGGGHGHGHGHGHGYGGPVYGGGGSVRPGPGHAPGFHQPLPRAGVRGSGPSPMGTPPIPLRKTGSSPRSTGSSSSHSSRRAGGIGFVKNYDARRASGDTAQSASSVSLHRDTSVPGRL